MNFFKKIAFEAISDPPWSLLYYHLMAVLKKTLLQEQNLNEYRDMWTATQQPQQYSPHLTFYL